MDTRLGLLSAASFAGVVIGGLLIADPGVVGAVNPAGLFAGEEDDHGHDDDEYEGEREDDDHEDEHEHEDDHEDEDEREDDDHEDGEDDHESTRSGDLRFARDSAGEREDDD